MKDIAISLIIPCFNEEERLGITESTLANFLREDSVIREIIFINDGSTDGTSIRLEQLAKSLRRDGLSIKVANYKINRGKGAAIREGIMQSNQDWILLSDCDFSCSLSELSKLMPYCLTNDVVFGSRRTPSSCIVGPQPWHRTLLGRVYSFLSQLLLRVPAQDFTCGFKLLRRDAILPVAQHMVINSWAYDSELLALSHHRGLRLREVGITWSNDSRTRVCLPRDIGETLWHLLLLTLRVHLSIAKKS